MLNRIPREVWISLFSIIITALLSHYIPKILEANSIELEYFESNKNEYINVPELLDGRVEILVDGKPQKNLTSVDILLFNRSHKDLKDIPITFEFKSPEPSKPIQLLSKQLSKPETFPKDSVSEVPQQNTGSVRYKIKSFPIEDDYSTDFVASFIFLGDIAPAVKVQSDFTDGKVIDIYKYDQSRRERKEIIEALSVLIPLVIIFFIFIFWQTKKDKIRMQNRIVSEAEKLVNKDEKLKGLILDIKKIALESYNNATGTKTNNLLKQEK
ncbi:hypothetical protein Q4561_18605 [Alteromonas sp. 1_MG-2023]|uniref:hypothetical protein n=1 Tax=Alteromonas sp. 1_MG-2023 TaxID=3062669 RepID=UPI0026E33090|nr:hypothetical protein [Alteromonas sp. 1_MG-2023]MDO6569090.1 hypothetical protein [Alteromonas sp. 1_MG-2023]